MRKRFERMVFAVAFTILTAVAASPAGRRPGPPPDPLGADRSACTAAPVDANPDFARRPGPPPHPLGEDAR